jgi:hypothetical protein
MYKIISSGIEFTRDDFGQHFPNVSAPLVLSQSDMDYLGLTEIPDPVPVVPEPVIPTPPPPPTPEQIQASVVFQTQQRLDMFARTRNYDGILSACTYATSAVPRFKSDADYCVAQRDATWAALYEFMAEVQAGTKPFPSGFVDIEPLLPVLSWPV